MTERVAIRSCVAADVDALALVGQATFLETFAGTLPSADILAHCVSQHSPTVYGQWLQDSISRLWIAETEVGGAGIGYLVLTKPNLPLSDLSATDKEVKRIYLLHRFHGLGIGKGMMDAAIQSAKADGTRRLLLGVYSHNAQAIAFYERQGYRQVGTRKFRVGHNDYDDVILALEL
jgi:ribosomal protein S18 acetylase RimI-like enzyme